MTYSRVGVTYEAIKQNMSQFFSLCCVFFHNETSVIFLPVDLQFIVAFVMPCDSALY